MNKLKILISLSIIATIVACSSNTSTEVNSQEATNNKDQIKSRVTLDADLLKRGYYMIGGPNPDTVVGGPNPDSTIVYHLNIELKNISNDSISFVSMSCSHEDMFVVQDSVQLKIHPYYMCYKNAPTVIQLAPHSTYSREIMIRPLEKKLKQTTNTKIGFELLEIKPKEANFEMIVDKYHRRHNNGITIWSNEILIEK